jgi:hypothetical protein
MHLRELKKFSSLLWNSCPVLHIFVNHLSLFRSISHRLNYLVLVNVDFIFWYGNGLMLANVALYHKLTIVISMIMIEEWQNTTHSDFDTSSIRPLSWSSVRPSTHIDNMHIVCPFCESSTSTLYFGDLAFLNLSRYV